MLEVQSALQIQCCITGEQVKFSRVQAFFDRM